MSACHTAVMQHGHMSKDEQQPSRYRKGLFQILDSMKFVEISFHYRLLGESYLRLTVVQMLREEHFELVERRPGERVRLIHSPWLFRGQHSSQNYCIKAKDV